MKIVDCVRLKKRKDMKKKWSRVKEKGRQGRRNKKETKRKRQGCDSVFSACAFFPQWVRHQYGLEEWAHPASSAVINVRFPTWTLTA